MADGDRLTLRQAREQGRIREFAEQAERDRKDATPISADEFDTVLRSAVKFGKSARRTSDSRARGGSSDK
jgi:hypothetical protein